MSYQNFQKTPLLVFAGLMIGTGLGLWFGPEVGFLTDIGNIYIRLLEADIYPYLICSIIFSLGHMHHTKAKKLFLAGFPYYVILVAILLLYLWFFQQFFPVKDFLVDYVLTDNGFSFSTALNTIIPANIYAAVLNNYIPAVVIFSILFGISLQKSPRKKAFLIYLGSVKDIALKILHWLILFTPLAVCFLVAGSIGTFNAKEFHFIGFYLCFLYLLSFLMLLVIFPLFYTIFLPKKYRAFFREFKMALLVALSTTLSVTAIPFIINAIQKSLEQYDLKDDDTNDVVSATSTICYPITQFGNATIYLFIAFIIILFGRHINIDKFSWTLVFSFLASIGSPSSVIPVMKFLTQWLNLPASSVQYFFELLPITRYAQLLVTVSAMAVVSYLTIYSYYGLIRISVKKSIVFAVFIICSFVLIFFSAQSVTKKFSSSAFTYKTLNLPKEANQGVTVNWMSLDAFREAKQFNIYITHTLKVGVLMNQPPYVFLTSDNQLSGFDVALLYKFAQDENIKQITFVPVMNENLDQPTQLKSLDLLIGGFSPQDNLLANFVVSAPYHFSQYAFLVKKNVKTKNICVLKNSVYYIQAVTALKKKNILQVNNFSQFLSSDCSRLLWSLEKVNAFNLIYKKQFRIETSEELLSLNKIPNIFFINKNAFQLKSTFDYWLSLPQTVSFLSDEQSYFHMF